MTREQAKREIDSLDYYLQNHTDDYSEESHTAMMMAISALSDYEKMQEISLDLAFENDELINKSRWIPVSERLPKDHEEVLIYLSTNRITIGLYNSHVLPLAPYKPIGWGVNAQTAVHNFCSDDVVAWMPLPEVYKAEKGSEE